MIRPDKDDVVVRQKRGDPVYLLGTLSAPDQVIVTTRDKGVKQVLAFAERQHVRAWFDNGDNTFVLLGTFRKEE